MCDHYDRYFPEESSKKKKDLPRFTKEEFEFSQELQKQKERVESKSTVYGEWQLCPKCHGQGIMSKPPYVPGDIYRWSSSTIMNHVCDVCNGKKILVKPIIG